MWKFRIAWDSFQFKKLHNNFIAWNVQIYNTLIKDLNPPPLFISEQLTNLTEQEGGALLRYLLQINFAHDNSPQKQNNTISFKVINKILARFSTIERKISNTEW